MTNLELYNVALIEQNKHEAPTLLIEEYNYLINKAIMQYINLTYARFDINQQASDDLRWLQSSVKLSVYKSKKMIKPIEDASFMVNLPLDYLHMLNCIVHFIKKGDLPAGKCPSDEDEDGIYSLCRRLTANQYPAIIKNAYFKPSYKNPYYFLGGTFQEQVTIDSIVNPDCEPNLTIDDIVYPCGNAENGLEMEIRCGKTNLYSPDYVYVDYLRKPQIINLTWEDVQSVEDKTAVCEFPDAVAYEIINIFCKLLFENAGDERLQTHYAINQTVGELPRTESSKK